MPVLFRNDQEPFSQTDIDAINEHWEMRALGVWNSVDLSGFCFKPMLVGYYCHLIGPYAPCMEMLPTFVSFLG
jgi:hypothetical protein